MYAQSFKELLVWQKSISLVEKIYLITEKFPKDETYILTSQIKRSAISIPANIAEGYKRRSTGQYKYFLAVSSGSVAELETHIIIAEKLYKNIDFADIKNNIDEVQKMLTSFTRKLRI
ncbi:MAG: four helix bundle protein [Candidatus Gracilibacteria bacterium]|jgi:four helix bundle protein